MSIDQELLANVMTPNEMILAFAEKTVELGQAVAKMIEVFEGFGRLPYIPRLSEIDIPHGDYERLARRVAAAYNCTHPARKLSWRRLNRPQRGEVVGLWLEEGR